MQASIQGLEGKTLLLLHTIEAKSGKERVNPVAYVRDDEKYVVIASKGGAPIHPGGFPCRTFAHKLSKTVLR